MTRVATAGMLLASTLTLASFAVAQTPPSDPMQRGAPQGGQVQPAPQMPGMQGQGGTQGQSQGGGMGGQGGMGMMGGGMGGMGMMGGGMGGQGGNMPSAPSPGQNSSGAAGGQR